MTSAFSGFPQNLTGSPLPESRRKSTVRVAPSKYSIVPLPPSPKMTKNCDEKIAPIHKNKERLITLSLVDTDAGCARTWVMDTELSQSVFLKTIYTENEQNQENFYWLETSVLSPGCRPPVSSSGTYWRLLPAASLRTAPGGQSRTGSRRRVGQCRWNRTRMI